MSYKAAQLAIVLMISALVGECVSAAPPCTRASEQFDKRFAAAAGCFIKQADRLLLVRNRFNGKLGFPAGFSNFGEDAQCTAHRETWEETGLRVEVGELVEQFGNGFLLYRCKLFLGQDLSEPIPLPKSALAEVSEILWVDPHSISAHEWRFSWQVPNVLRIFDQSP